ncbi:hypothetical protein KPL74_07480 [Bacillus sp. NP157]|nr:hypothetical protein KPL74_07480 [Bacillus sp. NP157]
MTARIAYAGEASEHDAGFYVLGGRLYSTMARQFVSPDVASPFDAGGLNRYAYCSGDPINRIDPSGDAWWDWLLAGVGLALSVVGAVASGGALVGAVGAAGSMMAALGTSSGAVAATAAVLDVVSVVAEIGATASLATGNTKTGAIFGWVGLGTGIASGAAGGAAWRMAKNAGKWHHASDIRWVERGIKRAARPMDAIVDVPRRPAGTYRAPFDRTWSGRFEVQVSRDGTRRRVLKPQLYRFTNPRNEKAFRYAVDSPIDAFEAGKIVEKIRQEHPKSDIFYYYGSHGSQDGDNWEGLGAARSPRHLDDVMELKADDDVIDFLRRRIGKRFRAERPYWASELPDMYKRDGAHFDFICYGAADRYVAELFDARPVLPMLA